MSETDVIQACGFDGLISDFMYHEEPVIAVPYGGNQVVSSTKENGTYIEHIGLTKTPPIKISDSGVDGAYFFGDTIDLLALVRGDTLSIVQVHDLKPSGSFSIRPGSEFVPKTGNSSKIGVVSKSGKVCVINDDGSISNTPLKVPEGYKVLWSNNVRPVGYVWASEGKANLYIRSSNDDQGAVLSSSYGFRVLTVWGNPYLGLYEAFIVTEDSPNVVKRVSSSEDGPVVDDTIIFPEGAHVEGISALSDGRPVSAYARHGARTVYESIPPEEDLTNLIGSIVVRSDRKSAVTCYGSDSLVSMSQNPATPVIPQVIKYAQTGRPTHEVSGAIRKKDMIVPVTNKPMRVSIGDREHECRVVSPYDSDKQTAHKAFILIDREGEILSGKYSPTVDMLCRNDYAVVIVSPQDIWGREVGNHKAGMLISALSRDIKKNKVSSRVGVIACGADSAAASMSLMDRKNSVDDVFLFEPTGEGEARLNAKSAQKITTIKVGDNSLSTRRTAYISGTDTSNIEILEILARG